MKSIIVGTAGHVDHGKTALVKALTGIDADRLEEEKRRGITIDLGFAHLDLPTPGNETLRLGFVDVPGHERFVRNMLAGVGGIDLVLLVIAADESIKPQTREHFDILQLLGVQRGITVVSKSDAVDAETLDVVRQEVEEFLRGTFLETLKAPIVAVSSLTGAGLDDLKRAIIAAAAQVKPRDSHALARLPIDRVFTMKGFGTVVTGTLISGAIHKEEELEVFPTGRRVRVRGVQVHGEPADSAIAGQRTALNLAGASIEDLVRGMTLAPPETFRTTRRADVRLELLPSSPRPLKNRSKVHFYCNTMETVAELFFYRRSKIASGAAAGVAAERPGYADLISPGQQMFVQLRFRDPMLGIPGDRFIIRQLSPVITIGGGSIVSNEAPLDAIDAGLHFEHLQKLSDPSRAVSLRSIIIGSGVRGISMSAAVARTGWNKREINELTSKLEEIDKIADVLISRTIVEWQIRKPVVTHVATFHKQHPLSTGIGKKELSAQFSQVRDEVFAHVLEDAAKTKHIEISGDLVRLPGHGVTMKDDEAESKKTIEEAFANAGLKVPALYEVLNGLKIDRVRAQKIVTLLLRDKLLIKMSDELVFHRSALETLKTRVRAQKARSSRIDVAAFKELTGVSRKYAIPLLEYLDRERVTRRVGDAREIL